MLHDKLKIDVFGCKFSFYDPRLNFYKEFVNIKFYEIMTPTMNYYDFLYDVYTQLNFKEYDYKVEIKITKLNDLYIEIKMKDFLRFVAEKSDIYQLKYIDK
jgi:hypothetical protein